MLTKTEDRSLRNIALSAQGKDRLTSWTIRPHWHPSVRRAIAMVVAVAVLAQCAACSYVPTRPDRPDERTCAQEKAKVLASAKDLAKDQQAIFFNVTVDDRWKCAAAVPKHNYIVDVFVTWSDGTTEKYEDVFWITTEPGRQYSLLAYEVGVGQVPATATLTVRKTPETSATTSATPTSVRQAAAGGFALALLSPILIPLSILAMPVTVPLFIHQQMKIAKPKQVRRDTGCCYVWIEDAETRETIVGTAPSAR